MLGDTRESHLPQRLATLIISFLVALVSGTSYLYGVYSPQLISRVGLKTSDSATISLATSLGSGIGGLPAGFLIDHEGPRISILVGAICIFCGYYGLYRCYQDKIANLVFISIAMVFIGFGSAISFYSTLKTAQSNFPAHRGAAGAVPVSAYGLSATIFSIIAAAFYSSDTGSLLKFLAISCGSIMFTSSFFIKLYVDVEVDDISEPTDEESAVISSSSVNEGSALLNKKPTKITRTLSRDRLDSLRGSISFWGTGSRTPRSSSSSIISVPYIVQKLRVQNSESTSQSSPFLSRNNSDVNIVDNSTVTNLKKIQVANELSKNSNRKKSPLIVIKELLSTRIFLLHFLFLSFASGIGQMYIYSVGFIVKSQFDFKKAHDSLNILSGVDLQPSAAALQALQVSVISLASFSGRLFAGFLSDFIYKRYHIQRLWIILFTLVTLGTGQLLAILNVSNANVITLTSGIIGGSYGLLFGVYPAVIADKFGSSTFSTTWGLICTGPSIILYFLNKYFGTIYDRHTNEDGVCDQGNICYKDAFHLSFGLCFLLFALNLIIIYLQRKKITYK